MHITSYSVPTVPKHNELYLVAKKDNIEINQVGDATINFLPEYSASNTVPLFAVVTRSDGILAEVKAEICIDGITVKKISEANINSIGSSNRETVVRFSDEIEYPKNGNYTLRVTQKNGCFATINISIHAIKV